MNYSGYSGYTLGYYAYTIPTVLTEFATAAR